MEKWNTDIYKNNNMKLMLYHIIFSVLSFLAGLLVLALIEKNIYGFALLGWSVIHALLAFGTFNKIELSRKASEYIFGLWVFAFPVGTFLSIYLILPATQWAKPED